MFIVLYRWRIKEGMEKQFVAAWSEVTAYYRVNFDSLGSRLHRGSDGLFYSYAQWRSAEHREQAFADLPNTGLRQFFRDSIEDSLPEIILENLSDYLILPAAK